MWITSTAPLTAADTDTRRLRGIAIPYGQQGFTSAGPVTIDAGAVRVPENLRVVKLFREHGRTTPLGYASEAQDGREALQMGFTVARTPDGDQALLEATEGLRDALSVELNNVTIEAGHVTAADLVAVAQVAVPAFAGAQLVATLTDEEQAQVLDLATQIVDVTTPTEEQPPPDSTATSEQDTAVTEASAAPAALTMTPPAAVRRNTDPGAARRLFAAQISEVMRGASDASQVNAALADIHPGNAGTDGVFPRPAWLGEIWSPEFTQRPIVDAIGVSPLTAMTMDGWRWTTKPEVAPYAGNKAEVPTGPAVIAPAQATAQRIAGGWDLDRIYLDFNTGFVDAFLRAAAQDFRKKSGSYFLAGHGAITGPPAIAAADGIWDDATDLGAQTSTLAAVSAIVSFLVGNGANVSFIAMGAGAFSDFLALDSTSVPWWLQQQGVVDMKGTSTVAGITIGVDPGLGDGDLLGGDRNAQTLWETGPINVQAINVPNGGVDLGVFGYWAQQVHDPDGLAKAQVTVTPLASDSGSSSDSRTAKKSSSSE